MNSDIIIHPSRAVREKTIPSSGILYVNPIEARIALQLLLDRGGDQRFLFHSGLVVSPGNDFFIAGPAVGAPMAAMVLEKLIILGAEKLIMTGWCGAVSPNLCIGDIVTGGLGFSGEGTSKYYTTDTVTHPSQRLLTSLQSELTLEEAVAFWSTDAPYRESRKMLRGLAKRHKIRCVDMEYSALCAVATFREVDFAAVFLISDELWQDDWRPGFNGKVFKRKSKAHCKQLLHRIVSICSFEEG